MNIEKTVKAGIYNNDENEKKPLLWASVIKFDFNYPLTDYGFITRLADENKWTKNFTEKAILEYKKFMFLAAASDTMVSPSEIVDIVWHQHLIFTESYNEFCNLLGKKIQHIPSTHNKAEFEKFKNAKDNTTKLYEQKFGKHPRDIWEYNSMYQSLELKESTTTLEKIVTLGAVISLIVLIPLHFLLQPLYSQINGFYFFFFYIPLFVIAVIALKSFTSSYLKAILTSWSKDAFIHDLSISEVIYLKKGKRNDVIHNAINKLIKDKVIKIDSKNALEISKKINPKSVEEFVILDSLSTLSASSSQVYYPAILREVTNKKIFKNTYQAMDKFVETIKSSKQFTELFLINYVVLSTVMIIGLIRLFMGISNDKPILFIAILLVALLIGCIGHLNNLSKKMARDIVPNFYKDTILPQKYGDKISSDMTHEWSYIYLGRVIFDALLTTLVTYTDKNNASSSDGGGSCGSSCGSSCGGGCGGCGG